MSLMGESKVVLLDEPTAGMDISSKRAIWELIKARKKNRIIIIATQDMEEANTLATRIGLVSKGKMILSGPPSFFSKKFKYTLQLVFSIKTNDRQSMEILE
jgi:ATP-binding cassette subfamily A (ABC1) protein 3